MRPFFVAVVASLLASPAVAQPSFVAHDPSAAVFGEPAGVTQREPDTPREGETVQLWIKTGPSFTYDNVAVYYTTDGSTPNGSLGTGFGTTTVLRNVGPGPAITFVRNEPGMSGNDDWWVATLPTSIRKYGAHIRYSISAWDSGNPIPEVFVDDGGGSRAVFEWTTLLAWPGAGSGSATPGAGYPPYHIWKEEAVCGNGDITVMLDQNGSFYDVYYPSAGAVQGVTTKNEGYYDGGQDQFPPFLASDQRGQMHLNQALIGLRPTDPVDGSGTTYWLSNPTGADYIDVSQSYNAETNVVTTTQRLVAEGLNVNVTQVDATPRGIAFPTDQGGNPNKGLHVKRMSLKNNGGSAVTLDVYVYADWALNGGDQFDGAFADASRGAMVAYDNTYRLVNGAGEYNPSTFGDYEKNVSVYLAAAMKINSGPATDSWADTSSDQGEGWIGAQMTLNPGQTKGFGVYLVGGFDPVAGATGTYSYAIAPAIDQLFGGISLGGIIADTETSWQNWLAQGVSFDCPDPAYGELLERGLLATALHLDDENGGIIAGMHNGAYPYIWPRDAAWAAITLARTGHVAEGERIFEFLRDVAYRDVEGWGRKGFWKQKYSTDGYTIWGNPQVDETSCYPWAMRFIYDLTGDLTLLEDHYDEVYEAAISSSQDSTVDSNLRYEESVDLVYSMSLWEDTFDVTIYSNASVIRGLEDAAAIADTLDQLSCPGGPGTCNYHNDKALFESRANDIRSGLDARLAWNGENTDISQLGITYPFEIYAPGTARPQLVLDRINGFAGDMSGNIHPLLRDASIPEWEGLVDRYWGDGYWNGGPWFLSTLWFGAYHAERSDVTAGKADIDVFKQKIDLLIDKLGPMGLGSEQIANNGSLLYAGQTDYTLQTAYPNAWESMSFLVDSVMLFLGYEPDAPGNVLRVRPKLPSDWSWMEYTNLTLGSHRVNVRAEEFADAAEHTFTNVTGNACDFDTVIRVAPGTSVCAVTINGSPASYTYDDVLGAVAVQGSLATGAGVTTVVRVDFGYSADITTQGAGVGDPGYGVPDGQVTAADLNYYVNAWVAGDLGIADITTQGASSGDPNYGVPDGQVTAADLNFYVNAWVAGGCG